MTKINLLPWREERRKIQLKQFLVYSITAVLFVILGCILVHMFYARILQDQYAANNLLQTEISILNQKIKEVRKIKEDKDYLTNRMQVVQELETNRSDMVIMFNEFVRTLPNGVYVTGLTKKGDEIIITGKAESNTRVSELMKNLENSEAFMSPVLTEIKSEDKENPNIRFFELKMQTEEAVKLQNMRGASS